METSKKKKVYFSKFTDGLLALLVYALVFLFVITLCTGGAIW